MLLLDHIRALERSLVSKTVKWLTILYCCYTILPGECAAVADSRTKIWRYISGVFFGSRLHSWWIRVNKFIELYLWISLFLLKMQKWHGSKILGLQNKNSKQLFNTFSKPILDPLKTKQTPPTEGALSIERSDCWSIVAALVQVSPAAMGLCFGRPVLFCCGRWSCPFFFGDSQCRKDIAMEEKISKIHSKPGETGSKIAPLLHAAPYFRHAENDRERHREKEKKDDRFRLSRHATWFCCCCFRLGPNCARVRSNGRLSDPPENKSRLCFADESRTCRARTRESRHDEVVDRLVGPLRSHLVGLDLGGSLLMASEGLPENYFLKML